MASTSFRSCLVRHVKYPKEFINMTKHFKLKQTISSLCYQINSM